MIEQEIDSAQMHLLTTLNKGRAAISAITLPADTALDGIALKDVLLPKGSLIISIVRGETLMIPNGLSTFRPADEIVAVCLNGSQKDLLKILSAKKDQP
jgi:trk system potassium uptake protein TrkA